MNTKLLGAMSAACVSLLLMACGDENTTQVTEVTETTGMEVVAAGDSLPECDEDNVGKMLFVTDSAKVYYCADGEWASLKGADGKNGTNGESGASCTAEALSDSTGYNVICDGDTVGTILNGDKGDKGNDGAAGTSCTAEALEDGSGYNVVCGGDTVGTILNGDKGDKGDKGTSCTAEALEDGSGYNVICDGDTVGTVLNGTDGASCSMEDNGDGTVTISCGEGEAAVSTTLYKAMCGTTPYDPANGFCYADSVYNFCDGSSYNPSTYFCYEDSLYSCGGAPYDPSKGFCYADSLYNKCGTDSYDPSSQFCYADSVYNFCDGSSYNPSLQYCDAGEVKDLETCGTSLYDPTKGFCYADSVYNFCGGSSYDPSSQFCDSRDSTIYKYVTIGTQTWMAENLNYDDSVTTSSLKGKSWCYSNSTSNCTKYGRLYTWAAAIDSVKLANDADNPQNCGYGKTCNLSGTVRGICPEGWHMPDTTEWRTLINTVGGMDVAGKALKSTNNWRESGNGTDAFDFTALPAGARYSTGAYYNLLYNTNFLGITEQNDNVAYNLYLDYSSDAANIGTNPKNFALSVRCLKD